MSGGSLTFPDAGPGEQVESTETFTLRYDPALGFDAAKLQWQISTSQREADLSVKLSGKNGKWKEGNITFAAMVNNAGPSTAQNVLLRVSIPEGVEGFSATGADCSIESAVIECLLGSINSGTQREIMIVARTADEKNKYDFLAEVSSSTFDPNAENNMSLEKFGGAIGWLGLLMVALIGMLRRREVVLK